MYIMFLSFLVADFS
ncbi:hypothetical protein ID866_11549 [Astraeus odoratus]|nr:hypothetical protein ID866_11549 [Astraeus odoratus]